MTETTELVLRAAEAGPDIEERHDAFEGLVFRFEAMAYACAYVTCV
ncbi:MAG TPA: hypothetical protein VFY10_09445 [Dehalococcoidia bacterium]|nr:hypothetical protein [Dehalococcoidia bacterium]